jgi:hypothetical protein
VPIAAHNAIAVILMQVKVIRAAAAIPFAG